MKTIHKVIEAELAQFYWEWGDEPRGYVTIGKYNNDDTLRTIGYMPKEWLSYPGLSHIKFNCPYK